MKVLNVSVNDKEDITLTHYNPQETEKVDTVRNLA